MLHGEEQVTEAVRSLSRETQTVHQRPGRRVAGAAGCATQGERPSELGVGARVRGSTSTPLSGPASAGRPGAPWPTALRVWPGDGAAAIADIVNQLVCVGAHLVCR